MTTEVAAAYPAVGEGTPLRFLPRAIRVPTRPTSAVAIGWATAFIPAILLGVLLALIAPEARQPDFPFTGTRAMLLLVVFAPVAETIAMGVALLILSKLVGDEAAIAISAVAWAALHSLQVPIWGLVIWWPFLIFSILFVTWRQRSLFAAFAIAGLVHALNNLIPALPIAYPAAFGA